MHANPKAVTEAGAKLIDGNAIGATMRAELAGAIAALTRKGVTPGLAVVLVGDNLYGFDGSNLTCLNWKTGEAAWSDRSVGKGSLVSADGLLFLRGERGTVAPFKLVPGRRPANGFFTASLKYAGVWRACAICAAGLMLILRALPS